MNEADRLKIADLQAGGRVMIDHLAFDEWIPTWATVLSISIVFPVSEPPLRRLRCRLRLDNHPFKDVMYSKIRDLEFYENNEDIVLTNPF